MTTIGIESVQTEHIPKSIALEVEGNALVFAIDSLDAEGFD